MNLYKSPIRVLIIVAILPVIFAISCFKAGAQQVPLKFSYLTVDDGLSHTDIKEIKQDKLGFIWIATLYGLNRKQRTGNLRIVLLQAVIFQREFL